jgi:hypothetical protein
LRQDKVSQPDGITIAGGIGPAGSIRHDFFKFRNVR